MNTLTNYTNAQRAEFMQQAMEEGKRIEKYERTLYALAENEIVENGQIVTDNERPKRLRKEQFEREFFNTSLGYVSRNVHMKNGEVWNFLKDILPNIIVGAEIITYEPNNDYTELNQFKGKVVTEQFINECKQQLLVDFYGN